MMKMVHKVLNVEKFYVKKLYRRLYNEFRREIDRAKSDYLKENCRETEELERTGRYDILYKEVKKFILKIQSKKHKE